MLDLTFSSEITDIGFGRISVTRFSDRRIERINSFAQYFYIDPSADYLYIYFELFDLYRCIVKYTYRDQELDVEIINNTDHEVILKTDDLEFVVEKIEDIYIENFKRSLEQH